MKDLTQVAIVVFVWFLVAVLNGFRDQHKGRLPFWKRPAMLVVCWLWGAVGAGIAFGGSALGQYLENHGYGIFGVIPAALGIILGALLMIGGIGCSFIVPWMEPTDSRNVI